MGVKQGKMWGFSVISRDGSGGGFLGGRGGRKSFSNRWKTGEKFFQSLEKLRAGGGWSGLWPAGRPRAILLWNGGDGPGEGGDGRGAGGEGGGRREGGGAFVEADEDAVGAKAAFVGDGGLGSGFEPAEGAAAEGRVGGAEGGQGAVVGAFGTRGVAAGRGPR